MTHNLDTIAAPATALVNQAISIIRVSGDECYSIVNKVFSRQIDKDQKKIEYGYIVDNQEIVDEVILVCFVAPYSFTGEDVIEINCHGGILVVNKILNALIKNGARLAKRGEFSYRAFLNKKINLIQAEAINDLIMSANDISHKIALSNLQNKNINKIQLLRNKLTDLIANIKVNIDYPEYDGVGDLTSEQLENHILELINDIKQIIKLSKIGKLINEGINVLILGSPNVGKSSLLNALLNENKAIVSDIPGTTRDIVEAKINTDKVTLNIIDTAGIRRTEDYIENIGIRKAKEQLQIADLVLLVFDISKELSIEEQDLLELTKDNKRIIILNKSDLDKQVLDENTFQNEIVIKLSAINRDIIKLINIIHELFDTSVLNYDDSLVLHHTNQISLLDKVVNLLENAYNNSVKKMPVDIMEIELVECWELLGELIGEKYDESLLDTMFKNYCLGK